MSSHLQTNTHERPDLWKLPLSFFLAAGLALSGLSHYLLFGLDKFAFAFLMRLSASQHARSRCTFQAAMGRWAGQEGQHCMGTPPRHHPRQKESWTALSEFTHNTHFSSRAVCFPLWPLTKNCNHISQLARSLAEEDCWRLHKLLHSRRRLMFLLWLYQYC